MITDFKNASTEVLQDHLRQTRSYLKESYNLRSKQGGWIFWNGDEEQMVERYQGKLMEELSRRKLNVK